MKKKEEVWKRCWSKEGLWASNLGRIKTDKYEYTNTLGRKYTAGGLRKLTLGKNGYYHFRLKGKTTYVHRVVCEAFHGECKEEAPVVNHKNLDKTDNTPENLEWCTYSENNRHARENIVFNRKAKCGEESHRSKLTQEQVDTIKANAKLPAEERETQKSLGDRFGVTQACVSLIVKGRNWDA